VVVMDLRKTLVTRLAAAFAVLLVLFGLIWQQDVREDARSEQQATMQLVAFLLSLSEPVTEHSLTQALTTGQFRHVKLQLMTDAPQAEQPAPIDSAGFFQHWLGLSLEGGASQRVQVGKQTVLISADPDSELQEKLRNSLRILLMLLAFCAACLALTWFAVHHALSPVKEINAGLVRLAAGEAQAKLPAFALREFVAIAQVMDQLADKLSRARESQLRLTRQLMEVQDKERRELAAELHDEFGQSLTAISATAAYIERHALHTPIETLRVCAQEIGSESRRISGHVRQMLTRLRPYGLEDSGIREALQELVVGWQARLPDRQMDCHIAPLPTVSAPVGLALYRCLQEALTNAVRHSGADHIDVRAAVQGSQIELTVSDNGGGRAEALSTRVSGGLLGLRERVTMAGGQFKISDRTGGGVVIHASLPFTNMETSCQA
jgi:two-component system sensor histidine kinase UhpB